MTERPTRPLDDEVEDEAQEEAPSPAPKKITISIDWVRWLNVAGSLAGVTALTLLTFEVSVGPVRLGRILAYLAGTSILISLLLLMVILLRWIGTLFNQGILKYVYWTLAIPSGLVYYLGAAYLVYAYLVRVLITFMDIILERAP